MGDSMPEVEVSIIIPCYNRWGFLPKVIESVFSQTFKNWELIIIDDASNNAPVTLKQKKTRYFRLDERRGSGYARNFGAKQSIGEFILFIDDDTIISPIYLASLLRTFKEGHDVGAVGGRLVYVKKGRYFDSKDFYDTPIRVGQFSGEVLGSFNRKTENVVEVPVLHAISLFKKDDFLAIGGFDEATYVGNRYREETDLFMRMRGIGKNLIYHPNAPVYHFDIQCGGQRLPLLKDEYYVLLNHKKFLKKFYSTRWLCMFFCFIFRRFYDRTSQLFIKTMRILRSTEWREFGEGLDNEAN
jgi:GT2 family glycosyltransferase